MTRTRLTFATVAAGVVVLLAVVAFDPRQATPGRGGARPSAAVGAANAPAICDVVNRGVPLPPEARESSGLARGIVRPEVFWTHNDSGNEPELYGVDEAGALVARVRLHGASLVDWEDIEAAPCASGSCLYIADTGDNDGRRGSVTIYEVAEPDAGAATVAATARHASYPDGARDAEALFAQRGTLYLVTKGRYGPVRLYRLTGGSGDPAVLQLIVELEPQPEDEADRVTAATSSPDGRWVVIRTHAELRFHPADRLVAGDASGAYVHDLRALGQTQGESVVLDDTGNVWLSSEAESGGTPMLAQLACALP